MSIFSGMEFILPYMETDQTTTPDFSLQVTAALSQTKDLS